MHPKYRRCVDWMKCETYCIRTNTNGVILIGQFLNGWSGTELVIERSDGSGGIGEPLQTVIRCRVIGAARNLSHSDVPVARRCRSEENHVERHSAGTRRNIEVHWNQKVEFKYQIVCLFSRCYELCWLVFTPQMAGTLLAVPVTVKMSIRHWVQVVQELATAASGLAIVKLKKSSLPMIHSFI